MRPTPARSTLLWVSLLTASAIAAACASRDTTAPVGARGADAAAAWIAATAHPIVSTSSTASDADLTALDSIVGTARLVGMGEATHGSHEFFTMKHRVFRYLVEHLGFTGFAIEATMPESFAVDTYVRTGVGDPALLLGNLHFWTWDTQEVLDLILWMRQYNSTRPASQQIGFYGFDMQYPGVAIDSVNSYVSRLASDMAPTVAADFACLAPFRNTPSGVFVGVFSQAPLSVKQACTLGLNDVRTQLLLNRDRLTAASSPKDFALALQMLRVAEQWVQYEQQVITRDQAMAENAGWLLDWAGDGTRLFLWAHDGHIARTALYAAGAPSMGYDLAATYGTAYRPIGTAFGSGSFNAVQESLGSNGALVNTGAGVVLMRAPAPLPISYETTLLAAHTGNYLIDLRGAPVGDAQLWFATPKQFREIGAVYVPEHPELFFTKQSLSDSFDALVFLETVTGSTLLR